MPQQTQSSFHSEWAEGVGDNQGEIDATVDGEPAKIAFNSKYLQDVLAVLDSGQVAVVPRTMRAGRWRWPQR